MRVKLLILMLILSFVVSCASEPTKQSTFQTQKVSEVSEGEGPFNWYYESEERREELNKIRLEREDKETLEEFERKSELSNVRRIIDNELVIGYDKELDDPDFKEVD